MRFNLTSTVSRPWAGAGSIPLLLTLRSSRGLPGTYTVATDSERLIALLRRGTGLSGAVLKSFRADLQARRMARLLAVEVNDELLREIGYFID